MKEENLKKRLYMIEELYKTKFELIDKKINDLEQVVMLMNKALTEVIMPDYKEKMDKAVNEATEELFKILTKVAPEGSILSKIGSDNFGYDPTKLGGE